MVKPKNIGNVKHYSDEDMRFATPVEVADYRADRLKCKRIVDLCSGIGIQADAFAETCSEVLAIEIDERKVEYSKKNFPSKKIDFISGDVLDKRIIEIVRRFKPDIIFCDPERLPSEKERNLETIKPDLRKLIEVYGKICENICIEVPPRIDLEKLNSLGEFEAEYLSLNNKLNRLDLLFGDLKEEERSVVEVKRGIKLVNDKNKNAKTSDKINDYIYEVSEAVFKADLINEFACYIYADVLNGCEKNKILLTSKNFEKNSLSFAIPYEVVVVINSFEDINKFLRENRFGKALIKYGIEPDKYWKERNNIEYRLNGNKEAVIFKINNKYVICEEYY